MRVLVENILDLLRMKKVDYGDVRVVNIRREYILLVDGLIEQIERFETKGLGIRVLCGDKWGFASVSTTSLEDSEMAVDSAIEIAKSTSKIGKMSGLSEEPPYEDTYISDFKRDPFKVSLEDKIGLLMDLSNLIKGKYLRKHFLSLEFRDLKQFFGNTEGSMIDQKFVDSGVMIKVLAENDGDVQIRTYDNTLRKGYEFIDELDLKKIAVTLSDEAQQLLFAPNCPEGEMDVILAPDQMALQIHESIGHPLELDRVLGFEASYAGTSFVTLDKLNNFRYGSELLNIYQDSTYPYGLGTFGYDDEGVKAVKVPLIKNGILTGFLSSRESAYFTGTKSSGAGRAQDWSRIPIVRMTNINLEPGNSSLDEMVASTDYGVYLKTNKSWSIDDKRLNFQFGTELGYLIKNGKIVGMVKNPAYTGITPVFWNNLVAVGNEREFEYYGLTNCGKGEPGQTMRVGHGSPSCKFTKVKVLPSR